MLGFLGLTRIRWDSQDSLGFSLGSARRSPVFTRIPRISWDSKDSLGFLEVTRIPGIHQDSLGFNWIRYPETGAAQPQLRCSSEALKWPLSCTMQLKRSSSAAHELR